MANANGDSQGLSRHVRASAPRAQAAEGANPTIRQRELGMRLRELRNGLGLTVEDVGARLLCSATKISRLETGLRRASLRDVRDLCVIYGVSDQTEIDRLMELARQSRQPGWWTKYDEGVLSPLLGLEQEAASITVFSMYFVPALLQTRAYAEALITGIERQADPEILRQRVEARMRRQQLLERSQAPRYRVLLDEAVLHRRVGGRLVMEAQLANILAAGHAAKAAVQVIPFEAGAHASTDSNFCLLEFGEDLRQGSVVFVEGTFSNRYLERPAEVERYREAIDYLREAALSVQDSAALIAQIRSGYHV